MMKKLKATAFTYAASFAYLFALADIGTNSWFVSYQPEIPEELQK